MNLLELILQNTKYFILLAIIVLIINFFTPITTSLSNLLDRIAPTATAEIISSQAIISSLRGIGRLVTVTSDPHTMLVHVGIKQGITSFDELTSYGADHEAHGIIEAGIDFTRIRSNGLRCEDTCTLIVPHPTITNCTITKLKQLDNSFAVGSRDWELLEELGRTQAIKLFIEKVNEQEDILDKAKEETEIVLGEFVSGLIGKLVHIEFEEVPAELITGLTCQPDPPFGWTEIDGVWSQEND